MNFTRIYLFPVELNCVISRHENIFTPFLSLFPETSFAQFNTIKQGTNNYKVKVLGIEKMAKQLMRELLIP